MKKVLLAFIILVGLTGCTKINNLSLDQIVNNTIETKVKLSINIEQGINIIYHVDYLSLIKVIIMKK